jgi:hypothetical protein
MNRRQTAAIHRMVHSEKNPLDEVLTVISRSKA